VAARNPQVRGLALGGAASALIMAVQVYFYHPDFAALHQWFALKAGLISPGDGVSKARLFALVPVRLIAFVGLSLVLGAGAGFLGRRLRRDPFAIAALAFLVCFAALVLALPNYFYMERTVYVSLLFPAAALTAAALQRWGQPLAWALTTFSLPGVIYAHLMLSVPDCSPTAQKLGPLVAEHSDIHDVVLTNIRLGESPFKSSDITGRRATATIADRLIYFNIEHVAQVGELHQLLKRDDASLVFILLKSRPLDSDLYETLRQKGKLEASFEEYLPVSSLTTAERLRGFVWYRVMRKGTAPPPETTTSGPAVFEVYRLRMRHGTVAAAT